MNIRVLLFLLFSPVNIALAQIKVHLQDESLNSVQGAIVYFQGKCYVSDNQGDVFLPVQKGIFSIKVSSLGFNEYVGNINVLHTKKCTITLTEAVNELSQVVVSSARTNKTVVQQHLSKDKILLQAGENLANMLKSLQGVSLLQTGASVSKPIIDGMHGNRILILNNGVRQEGQHWGADHAPEIDPSLLRSIKVVKGAESVRYGADALGGVIILQPEELPFNGNLEGELTTSFASNGRKTYTAINLGGSLLNSKSIAWRVLGSTSKAGDLKTANYYLNNTGMAEKSFLLSVGYQSNKWKIDTFFSNYQNELGVFLGSHIGNLDDLLMRFEIGEPLSSLPFSYTIAAPKQRVLHNLFKMKGSYFNLLGGKFEAQYAFQYNKRREFDVRRMNMTAVPVLDLELRTHSLDFSWQKGINYWRNDLGMSFLMQENYNKPGTGVTPIIPNFAAINYGMFAVMHYKKAQWNAELGLRYDYKTLHADGYNSFSERYSNRNKFHNITHVLGINYSVDEKFSFTSNIGLAWRSPHVSELYSNGLHHGEATYVMGDINLQSERGIKWVNGLRIFRKKWNFSGDFFIQYVRNYIYDYPTGEIKTLFSGDFPLFAYTQHNAFFRGASLKMVYNFSERFAYTLQTDVVYASKKEGGYFPFIPPERLSNEFGYVLVNEANKKTLFKKIEANLTHRWVAKQQRYDPNQELAPTTPAAYHLFETTLSGYIPFKERMLMLHFGCENVFNALYKDYTNRFRFYAHDLGRNLKIRIIYKF